MTIRYWKLLFFRLNQIMWVQCLAMKRLLLEDWFRISLQLRSFSKQLRNKLCTCQPSWYRLSWLWKSELWNQLGISSCLEGVCHYCLESKTKLSWMVRSLSRTTELQSGCCPIKVWFHQIRYSRFCLWMGLSEGRRVMLDRGLSIAWQMCCCFWACLHYQFLLGKLPYSFRAQQQNLQ